MKRRHFLLQAASGLPCCLIDPDLIRRAAAAFEANDPVRAIGAPTNAAHTLYAVQDSFRFSFWLDSLSTEPDPMTWREWADSRACGPFYPLEVLEKCGYEVTEKRSPRHPDVPCLDDLVPADFMDDEVESWGILNHPQVRAYSFLSDIEIGNARNARSAQGEPLGELEFSSGWNHELAYVTDQLVLPALQRRLLELGEDVSLVVR